jgi:exopolysaccharide production protein ExoQ
MSMRGSFLRILDVIILGLVSVLTHQTMFVCYQRGTVPLHACTYGSPQGQLSVLFIIVLFVFWRIRFNGEEKKFVTAWQHNWLLGLFICLALASLIWTVLLSATIYRSLLLLFITLIAAYFGMKFSPRNLVNFVAVIIGIFALASLLLAVIWPSAGITSAYPYEGLWRGIFWHKIYLGATMALGYPSYLVILFSSNLQYARAQKFLALGMLVVCSGLAVLSDSASGLVVFVIQTGLFILLLLWLVWEHLLSRRSYWLLGGVMVFGLFLVMTNLDFIFGFFNRSASLTGRVPMWLYVLENYFVKKPWFGHGFGAFWLQPGINQAVQSVVKWPYPVKVSDSGYLDVLLGLGVAGLLLMLSILFVGFRRAILVALQDRDLIHFFPLFVLVHILFINISLSYFVEMESFVWFLLVVVLFIFPKEERDAFRRPG